MAGPARTLTLLLAVEEAAGLQLLQTLLRTPHRIAGVAVTPGDPAGVERLARRHALTVWPAARVRDPAFAREVRAAGVDLLLNVHSLHIVCPAVLEAPRLGAYNLHPGPLPRYAGLNAPSWAIFNGETEHAVTLHRMVPAVDAGPVAGEARFPITADDTALAVYTRCAKLGLLLVTRLVDHCAQDPDSVGHWDADPAGRRVYGRRPPNGGWIDWDWPAATIANLARACAFGPFASPWGLPMARLEGDALALAGLRRAGGPAAAAAGTVVAAAADGSSLVAARDGMLTVPHVVRDGRRVPAASVLAAGCRLLGSTDTTETKKVA